MPEPAPKCVILHATVPYRAEHDTLLRAIVDRGVDLFAAVGVDCENWEEAMDWLCVMQDIDGERPGAFCLTSSHPGETLAEVMEFAEGWCDLGGGPRHIDVVEV